MPLIGPALGAGAASLPLLLALWRCDVHGVDAGAVGLCRRGVWQELAVGLGVAGVVLPLYGAGLWAVLRWQGDPAAFALPRACQIAGEGGSARQQLLAAADLCLRQWVGVALPEEVFYRGYLQAQLQAALPPRRWWFGAGLCLSSLLFALGHVVGTWDPLRLLPFFPGLLFGVLRNRRGSVVGAMVLHGACNVGARQLAAGFGQLVRL